MSFADYYSTEQLRGQAEKAKIDPNAVVEVAHVLKDANLEDALRTPVDFIIANHVVEHLIDPLRWMKNLERVLNPGGFLFITLPDKKFSFDKFRPDTSLAHFLSDMLSGGEQSLQEHCIEAGVFYDKAYIGQAQDAELRLNLSSIESFSRGWHPGMHVHVFQAETFKDSVLQPLLHLGYFDYSLERYVNNPDVGEFSFVLRKGANPKGWDPNAIYRPAYDSQFTRADN
jgi:SAM-dependent methyltransferase